MNVIRVILMGIRDGVKFVFGILGSYLGVISQVIGAMFGVLASVLLAMFFAGVCVYVKVLPDFTEAREEAFDKMAHMSEDDFIRSEDSIIYDEKGEKIGSVNTGRYTYVTLQEISPYLYNGYIAVEDKRFKTHAGIDVLATLRAGVKLLRNGMEIRQGGSTITQQVIKNNLLTQEKSYTRKIAEILLAPVVEAEFSKDKIMEFYCNSNYYGNRCYGVGAASQYYFGKACADLKPQEAAILIALSNNPSKYNPVDNPENAKNRRNEILDILYTEGVITEKECTAGKKAKLKVLQLTEDGSNENYMTGYAIHCAALALMEKENFHFQYVFKDRAAYESYQKEYSELYSKKSNDIRSGGYKLYTSLNQKKQKKLQKAVDEGLAYNTDQDQETGKYELQGAAVCVDNRTDYVVAVVGGRGTEDQFNRAYLSLRQSGSSIKPLLDYAPGFESGVYFPSTLMNDHELEDGPQNAGGGYRGEVRIREAVARSINTIAWQVLETITPEYGLSFLEKMRFHGLSYIDNDSIAISLGGFTEGVRVVDMAKGYSTLANGGKYSGRTCIRKIEHTADGVIYNDTDEQIPVYSEDTAFLMTDVLKGVLEEEYGTGHSLRLENGQICAGKTGTTNSGKDVWFCGYTRYYTSVFWAGYDTPKAMPGASGASVAGGMWKQFMDEIHKNLEPKDFDVPDTICLAEYQEDGSMKEGTEESGTEERSEGKDYFSKQILSETSKSAKEVLEDSYQKTVLKQLKTFEKMSLDSLSMYYEFQDTYTDLRKAISLIEEQDVRKEYATRAKNKYDTMKKERVNWKEVIEAYTEAKKAEEELEEREYAVRVREAQEAELQKRRVQEAKAKVKLLKTYWVRPEDAEELISEAREAVEQCRGYEEYYSLRETYEENAEYLRDLPDEEDASDPEETLEPLPEEEEEDDLVEEEEEEPEGEPEEEEQQ